jgi:DNA-binding transcriptional ArsR family regulator
VPRDSTDPRAPAEWLSAIADPVRIAMLRALASGEKSVPDLARACGVERGKASHHLKQLKAAGLVAAERARRFVLYRLVGATATATLLRLAHASGFTVTIPLG